MEKLFASEQRTVPAPVGPFFGVDTIMTGGSTGAGEFFPASGVCAGARRPVRLAG